MPIYRSAGLLHNGSPIFNKFESDNLVVTLRAHNVSQFTDYDLYMDLGGGKEQLMLEINTHEVTYGSALYDKVVEQPSFFSQNQEHYTGTNVVVLPSPTAEVTPGGSIDPTLELTLIDVPQNHRKIKLKKAL